MEIIVNFSGRALDYTDDEMATVIEALTSANPLTQGRYQMAFQEKFAAFNQVPYAFAMFNGTCALETAAQLCQLKEGTRLSFPCTHSRLPHTPLPKKGKARRGPTLTLPPALSRRKPSNRY